MYVVDKVCKTYLDIDLIKGSERMAVSIIQSQHARASRNGV